MPALVRDINAIGVDSNPTNMVDVGGTLFFTALDEAHGIELWKSDGTESGTVLVKDIAVGSTSSSPGSLANVGGTLYFSAYEGTGGTELWKSDGTESGTVRVKDISVNSSVPFSLTNVGGTLFFRADDTTNGTELWKSDGTEAGTVLVKDINAGSNSSIPNRLTNVGGTLYFSAFDGAHGIELWKSDGTEAGTVRVKDINAGSNGSGPFDLTNVGGTLYFSAFDGTHGFELWKSDGSEAGTVLVKDIIASTNSSSPSSLRNVGGTLYFQAHDVSNGLELWKSDGTEAGTVQVKDIWAGPSSSAPSSLTNVGGTLYFQANDGTNGFELWKSDGTEAGTVRVKDINIGANSSTPGNLTNVGGTLYFSANDSTNGTELWKSDGSEAGTVRVKDIYTGTNSFGLGSLTNVGGTLFFTGNDGTHGYEMWSSDGTEAGTLLVKDIYTGTIGSSSSNLTNVGGTVFFTANNGTHGTELWKSDGTEVGTVLVKDINVGATGSSPGNLTNVGGTLYFVASEGTNGTELWKSDGTEAGTVLVKDILAGSGSADPRYLTNVGGTLFFMAYEELYGLELWKSDGTEAGTVLVKDIHAYGYPTGPVRFLTDVGGTLYFNVNNGTNGYELWKSDGTEAGTVQVKDIFPGGQGSDPNYLTNVGGTLYFRANDGTNGYELWKSDGTEAGTVQVKDIIPGPDEPNLQYLTNVGGTLFFHASDGTNGRELWKSDGTDSGTVQVKDIAASSSSSPSWLTNVGGTLYFQAYDGANGTELWKSDGTEAGTVRVKDIWSGASGSSPQLLTNVNGIVYFQANDGTNGIELWKSDGTEAGTVQVKDLFAGSSSSNPTKLTNVAGTLFFSADDGFHGNELWKYFPNEPPTVATPIADFAVDEDAADTLLDLSATFADVDIATSGDILTLTVTDNTNTGLVTASLVGTTLTLDYQPDQYGTATITIRATDLAGEWVEDTFTVTVDPVNDTPTVLTSIADVTVDEEAADTVLDLSGTFVDVDSGDSLTLSVTGNTNISLVTASLVGTTLTLDYQPDQHGTATITIRATDLAGDWVEDTFVVTVDPANDTPTVAAPIDDITVDEDAVDTLLDLSATFADVDIATSGDILTLTVTGNTNTGLVTAGLVGSMLTLDYQPDQYGTATLTIRATDLAGEWVEDSFTITVDSVNDTPTVAVLIADVTVDEDAANTVLDLSGTFADVDIATSGDILTLTVTGNTNTSLVTASLVGTTLILDYQLDQHGTATITVRATDLAGDWVEDTFTVTVDPVNDTPTVAAPIADVTVDEDAADAVLDLSGTFADVDIATSGDGLALSVVENTNTGLVTTSLFGTTLTLDYQPDQHGTATITIRATDLAGDWVEETFTVTVDAVNDVPTVATLIADVTVDEDAVDTLLDLSSTFADVDIATSGDGLTLTVTGNTNTGLVTTSLVGTMLTLDYQPNQHGTATITVRATDEAGEWVETSFLVTVNSVEVVLPFSDEFNRTDGTALGDDWIETLGNLGISSQHVVLFQNTESTAIVNDLLAADVSIEAFVDLTGAEVGRSIALMARAQGPGDQNAYWGVFYRSDSGYAAQIYKNIAGVPTPLRSVNVPGPVGTMRLEVFSTTLNLYFNDTLVTSAIDDSLLSAGAVGVRQTGGTLDNFAAEVAVPPISENAVLPFADHFDRADNSLFGSVWTERSGDSGVRGEAAGLYANDVSVVTLNGVSEADVSVSADIDIVGVPGQYSSGLLARYSGPGDANTYMARLYRSDSGSYAVQLWKNVDGAYTPLRSVLVACGHGNLRLDIVGDRLQLFFNEELLASTIDTSITGPGQVGMRLGGGTLDNFSATELAPPIHSDATLPFVDNFSRSDSSWPGEFWTERAGDLGIRHERIELFAGEQSVATLNGIAETDLEVSAEIDITSGGNAGLLARYAGPGDANGYLALLQPASGGTFAAQIWKNTGTDWENLTHTAIGAGAGELRFLLEGTHLQLYLDDLLVGDVNDSSITAPGTVGVRMGGGSIDDFSASLPEAELELLLADQLFDSAEDWAGDALLEELLK